MTNRVAALSDLPGVIESLVHALGDRDQLD